MSKSAAVSAKTRLSKKIREKAKNVKLLILDIDGVLSDGRMVYTKDGNSIKSFDVKDGLGVYLIGKTMPVVVLTAQNSPIVQARAKDLKVKQVYSNLPKETEMPKIIKKFKVAAENICYIGDDVIDVECAKMVGFSVAVNDAVVELKKVVDYITPHKGGYGAVRHLIELIMKAQKTWPY